MLDAAGKAFVLMFNPWTMLMLCSGVIMGLVLGILPGIGGLAGTALLLPLTFSMDPIAAMALLLRVMASPFGHLLASWQTLVVIVSMASMVLGALAAIGQTNIKRLLAYSSIGHMGYALIGLASGSQEGIRGVLVYMAIYVAMTAGTFACVMAMRRNGRAAEEISDLSGLSSTDAGMAFALAVFMFSLSGIPLLAEVFAKLYVFLAAVKAGLWALAIVGVLSSVVGAFYYIRIIKLVYFDEATVQFDRPSLLTGALMGASSILMLAYFVYPARLVSGAESAAKALFLG